MKTVAEIVVAVDDRVNKEGVGPWRQRVLVRAGIARPGDLGAQVVHGVDRATTPTVAIHFVTGDERTSTTNSTPGVLPEHARAIAAALLTAAADAEALGDSWESIERALSFLDDPLHPRSAERMDALVVRAEALIRGKRAAEENGIRVLTKLQPYVAQRHARKASAT